MQVLPKWKKKEVYGMLIIELNYHVLSFERQKPQQFVFKYYI